METKQKRNNLKLSIDKKKKNEKKEKKKRKNSPRPGTQSFPTPNPTKRPPVLTKTLTTYSPPVLLAGHPSLPVAGPPRVMSPLGFAPSAWSECPLPRHGMPAGDGAWNALWMVHGLSVWAVHLLSERRSLCSNGAPTVSMMVHLLS